MAGSLDGRKTVVIGREDYEFLLWFKDHAEVWVSPQSTMTAAQIAAELRRMADIVEGGL